MAFALFADSDRSREAWPLDDHRYAVVQKAANADRNLRHQSIREFIADWNP